MIVIANSELPVANYRFHGWQPARLESQKVVFLNDGTKKPWSIEKSETAFVHDANKQVSHVSLLAVSDGGKLLANAIGTSVQIWNLGRLSQGAHYLTVGSRSVKTNMVDPDFPEGTSKIVVTQSKVVVALGNVIRAYSFDMSV